MNLFRLFKKETKKVEVDESYYTLPTTPFSIDNPFGVIPQGQLIDWGYVNDLRINALDQTFGPATLWELAKHLPTNQNLILDSRDFLLALAQCRDSGCPKEELVKIPKDMDVFKWNKYSVAINLLLKRYPGN